jgi:hypothetical protein
MLERIASMFESVLAHDPGCVDRSARATMVGSRYDGGIDG